MGEEMFFIEKGEVTLERMRNLGPGHSSSFDPGPLDQGKYPHMNVCLFARSGARVSNVYLSTSVSVSINK